MVAVISMNRIAVAERGWFFSCTRKAVSSDSFFSRVAYIGCITVIRAVYDVYGYVLGKRRSLVCVK